MIYNDQNFSFRLVSLEGKKDGEIVLYSDKFNIFFQDIPLLIDSRRHILQTQTGTQELDLYSFKFISKDFGYYCENKKVVKISLNKNQLLKVKEDIIKVKMYLETVNVMVFVVI